MSVIVSFTERDGFPLIFGMMIEEIVQCMRFDQRGDTRDDEESGIVEEKGDRAKDIVSPEIRDGSFFGMECGCPFPVSCRGDVPPRSDVPFGYECRPQRACQQSRINSCQGAEEENDTPG